MNPNDFNSEENPNKLTESEEKISVSPSHVDESNFSTKKDQEKITISSMEENSRKKTADETANGMKDVVDYIRENKEALFTYVFLLAGILLLVLGNFFLGSLVIGLTAGYHFSYEVVFYLRNLSHIFEGHEHIRFIVLTAMIIALILAIPGMFLGAVIAAVFKHVIYDKSI